MTTWVESTLNCFCIVNCYQQSMCRGASTCSYTHTHIYMQLVCHFKSLPLYNKHDTYIKSSHKIITNRFTLLFLHKKMFYSHNIHKYRKQFARFTHQNFNTLFTPCYINLFSLLDTAIPARRYRVILLMLRKRVELRNMAGPCTRIHFNGAILLLCWGVSHIPADFFRHHDTQQNTHNHTSE